MPTVMTRFGGRWRSKGSKNKDNNTELIEAQNGVSEHERVRILKDLTGADIRKAQISKLYDVSRTHVMEHTVAKAHGDIDKAIEEMETVRRRAKMERRHDAQDKRENSKEATAGGKRIVEESKGPLKLDEDKTVLVSLVDSFAACTGVGSYFPETDLCSTVGTSAISPLLPMTPPSKKEPPKTEEYEVPPIPVSISFVSKSSTVEMSNLSKMAHLPTIDKTTTPEEFEQMQAMFPEDKDVPEGLLAHVRVLSEPAFEYAGRNPSTVSMTSTIPTRSSHQLGC